MEVLIGLLVMVIIIVIIVSIAYWINTKFLAIARKFLGLDEENN